MNLAFTRLRRPSPCEKGAELITRRVVSKRSKGLQARLSPIPPNPGTFVQVQPLRYIGLK